MTQSLQERLNALNDNKEQAIETEKQLITIEPSHALGIFTEQSKLNEVITSIKMKIKSIVPDIYSDKGRKEIASMAYSVARTKTYLDSIGKDLVDQYKEIPKKIDSNRKFARDALDSLRDEIRKPLTLWEEEQEALRLKEKIALDHLDAIEMHNEWLNRRAEKLELERLREEEKIRLMKEEADAKARADAQRELERMKIKHEQELAAQKQKQIDAEMELARAEQRRLQEIEAEKKRSAEQARIILEKQKNDELRRKQNEELAIIAERNRINDDLHRKTIRQEILDDMVMKLILTKEKADEIIFAIELDHIRHLSIKY